MVDINELKRLLASGQITQEQLSQTPMSGSFGPAAQPPQNALAQMTQQPQQQQMGPPADMSQFGIQDSQRPLTGGNFGALDHEQQAYADRPLDPQEKLINDALAAQNGDQDALARVSSLFQSAQPPTNDLRKQGANFVRNESTGQTIFLGPNGQPSDRPTYGSTIQSASGPTWRDYPGGAAPGAQAPAQPQSQPSMMSVIGTSGGTRVSLPPEQAPDKVNLDYSVPPLQLMGGAKAIYSKDEPGVAYVMKNGVPVSKVILGYDMQGSMALNEANAKMAQTQAQTAHTLEETRASQVNSPNLTGSGSGSGVNMSLTGDQFLKQLDPGIANEVKALGDGRTPFNPRSQRQLNLLSLVQQYNPNWSATDYQEKLSTTKSFAPGGVDGKAVQAINQAIIHAGEAVDSVNRLDNGGFAPGIINPIRNTFDQKVLGDTRQTQLATTFNALGEELKKAYGGGSLAELENWQKSLDPNASKDQQLAGIAEAMRLLQGAVKSRQQQYQRGMGSPLDFGKVLDPDAKAALLKLEQGRIAAGLSDSLGLSQPAQSQQVQSPAQSIPAQAVAFLRQNPASRYDFDKKYGQGMSAQVLGQ